MWKQSYGTIHERKKQSMNLTEDQIKNFQKRVLNAKSKEEVVAIVKEISKSEYIRKINQIEQGLSNLDYLNARALNFEFKEVEMEIYNSWEKALNEIYEALSQQLTSSEMAILREEQHQWIMERELTAKKESQHESGTLDSLKYLSVLTSLTKERCYELMDHIK